MAGKQTAQAPSASGLRVEARLILDRIKVTADRQEKRRLAISAFELVQLAEQLLRDEEQRRASPTTPEAAVPQSRGRTPTAVRRY